METPNDPTLEHVVEQLAKAQTPSELAAAHRAKLRAIKARRQRTYGPLARAYMEAMEILDAQKAAGVSFVDRMRGLDAVLREVWPFTRAWHYVCDACDDTGLVMAVCRKGARCNGISTRTDGPNQTPGKYRRLCAQHPESDYTHDYGTPCLCAKGARFREKPKATAEDFTSAGKSKPMTRIGR